MRTPLSAFESRIHDLLPELERVYTDIHAHAELSMEETRTSRVAADRLRGAGYDVTDGTGKTGVVGLLRNGMFGRGAHGSMPQASIDPVVMAAATVLRLQTIVSREVAGTDAAVVTVAALQAGDKENVIPSACAPRPMASLNGMTGGQRWSHGSIT